MSCLVKRIIDNVCLSFIGRSDGNREGLFIYIFSTLLGNFLFETIFFLREADEDMLPIELISSAALIPLDVYFFSLAFSCVQEK